jgi:anti-sigma regulatory factor (Ser/Thr protein kinase)
MDVVPLPVGPAVLPGSTTDRMIGALVFGQPDLDSVRAFVNAAGVNAEVETDDLAGLVLAVSEIATNAVRHGGGVGSIAVEQIPAGLRVDIRDKGPGLPDGLVIRRPSPDALGGRGLWLAHLFCTGITMASSASGVTVTMVTASGRHPA